MHTAYVWNIGLPKCLARGGLLCAPQCAKKENSTDYTFFYFNNRLQLSWFMKGKTARRSLIFVSFPGVFAVSSIILQDVEAPRTPRSPINSAPEFGWSLDSAWNGSSWTWEVYLLDGRCNYKRWWLKKGYHCSHWLIRTFGMEQNPL